MSSSICRQIISPNSYNLSSKTAISEFYCSNFVNKPASNCLRKEGASYTSRNLSYIATDKSNQYSRIEGKNSILKNLILDFSKNPKISPVFYLQTHTNGSDYTAQKRNVYIYGWGIDTSYKFDNISLESNFVNHTFIGVSQKPNKLSARQGLAQFINWPYKDTKTVFDSRIANMKLTYNKPSFGIELGKYNRFWGPGISSLIISNKPPSYPQLGFHWQINKKMKFLYFTGILRSLIHDEFMSKYYANQIRSRYIQVKRSISAHRLEYSLLPSLHLSITESMVYATRNFEIHYFPFIAFWPMKNYIGDIDNMQISVDLDWQINNNLRLYTSVFIDEMDPRGILTNPLSLTKKENENWWGWQFGSNYKNFLLNSDLLRMEYNWLDHRIYRNKISANDYYHYGFPLGFWAGPHSEEIYIDYTFNIYDSLIRISYSNVKRGRLTNQMLTDAYNRVYHDRYENGFEQKKEVTLIFEKQIFFNFYLAIGFEHIDWLNPNFDPYQESSEKIAHEILKKNSISISLNYRLSKRRVNDRN